MRKQDPTDKMVEQGISKVGSFGLENDDALSEMSDRALGAVSNKMGQTPP